MSYAVRQNPATGYNFMYGREGSSVDKIVIHHAATTDFDGIGRTFQGVKQVSAHYGVGRNQNVDQYVNEADTAYHAGNWPINLNSIGIENVNSTGAPSWEIAPETFNTLIELVRDIATRHKLLPLVVGKNLFGHKDFSQTACPDNLYPRLQELADAVNNGTVVNPPVLVPDQILEVGSKFKFADKYAVNGLAYVNDTWQIQTNALCPKGFNWNDNGVPTEPVSEIKGGAGNPDDQVLQVGSLYHIPGEYMVQKLGLYQDRWMVQTTIDGWSVWVDAESLVEV